MKYVNAFIFNSRSFYPLLDALVIQCENNLPLIVNFPEKNENQYFWASETQSSKKPPFYSHNLILKNIPPLCGKSDILTETADVDRSTWKI